jgi:carbon-monoxide dehydrogenase medium subunit
VIPAKFDYAAPASLAETVTQLANGADAHVLAGGQGLVPALTTREATAGLLVDLRNVPDLADILPQDSGVRIGAMVTLDEVAASTQINGSETALTDCLAAFGDPQVRNRATIGGALAHTHHGVDLPAVAVALDASISVFGADAGRTVAASELFGGLVTALGPAEVITSVSVPVPASGAGSAYEKVRNPGSSYAICGVAASIVLTPEGTIDSARVVVAGATAAAVRIPKVEAALAGQPATQETLAAAAGHLPDEGLTFPSDLAAPADYRAHLAEVLIIRALARATDRARKVSS